MPPHHFPVGGVSPTRIGDIDLKSSKSVVGIDEPLSLSLRFRVLGGLRDIFTQELWERAYEEHDVKLFVRFQARLQKVVGHMLKRDVVKPLKFSRWANLYWSQSPDLPYRIWVMVVQESRQPILPKSVDQAKEALFDVSKTFELLGSDLGQGTHTLTAAVGVRWARHSYVQHGTATATSNYVRISVR